MGYYCTVPQCTSLAGKTKNVKFHRFPRDVTMADKWNLILKRGKPYTKYSKVCSLHFTQADYNVTTMGQWKTLSKDAVPSQNLPKLNPDGTVMVIRKSRTVKYREGKKEEIHGEKVDKWSLNLGVHGPLPLNSDQHMACDPQDDNLAYRYSSLNTLNLSPQIPSSHLAPAVIKPKKQDAFMQTDPVQSEEDDSQPNNSYAEASDKYAAEYSQNYQKDPDFDKKYSEAKDYTNKPDDYLPQTNEEYNKEAEKYALERNGKLLNGYEKPVESFPKTVDSYQKNDLYSGFEKPFRPDYGFQNYSDSVELLRHQQHNLQMLQEQPHRITENQNFFNENHIKQEMDINVEDDKFSYDRNKEQLDADMYGSRRLVEQQRLLETIQHQVKQEPDTPNGCENVMQPQGSPYYQSNNHNNVTGGYYDQLPRPGPELLIAKQNALAAHTQLWQNTMKRPFFYSESPHYNSTPLLHRYEDISRILQ